jgi:chromate reductase
MPPDIHILGFAGSLRAKSYNRAALRAAQEMLPEGVALEITTLDDLPPFNEDLGNDPPEPVRVFKEKIRQADALLMAVPEFNYSFPGVLKNAIDWASYPFATSPMNRKPTAILGAGGRYGTVRAQLHIRQVFLFTNNLVVTKPEVHIVNAWEKFDSGGRLTDETARKQIRDLLVALIKLVREAKEQ